jgi:hypothetical protein
MHSARYIRLSMAGMLGGEIIWFYHACRTASCMKSIAKTKQSDLAPLKCAVLKISFHMAE